MEVYDEAHALARSLRNSPEFRRLLAARENLAQQPEKLKRVKEFKAREFEAQARQLAGEEIASEKLNLLQQMAEILLLDPAVRDYLEAEARFIRLFSDVQKILADAVKEWEPLVVPGATEADKKGEGSGE